MLLINDNKCRASSVLSVYLALELTFMIRALGASGFRSRLRLGTLIRPSWWMVMVVQPEPLVAL